MQSKHKLAYIALGCVLLNAVLLLINVRAQASKQARVTFNSDRDGNWEVYVMDADGKNPRNLTNNSAGDEHPDWFDPAYGVSPAGKLKARWGWLKQTSK